MREVTLSSMTDIIRKALSKRFSRISFNLTMKKSNLIQKKRRNLKEQKQAK